MNQSVIQPTGLKDIQRRMAAAVMHPLARGYAMPRRRRDGTSNISEAESIILPNDRLTSFKRLEIYNRQYWFRLLSSFEEDFPGLEVILGRAKFDRLARECLTDCPSESFTLRNLGSGLEAWLNDHPEYIEPHVELARDMVRLEWAHIEAFDAEERPRLRPEQLAGVGELSVLHTQPYLRLLALRYPVDDLLVAVRSENGSSASTANNASVARKRRHARKVATLEPKPLWLAVHRQQNTVWYKPLGEEEFRLLTALNSGQPLGDAINAALVRSAMPESQRAASVQEAFTNAAALGWFTSEISELSLDGFAKPEANQ